MQLNEKLVFHISNIYACFSILKEIKNYFDIHGVNTHIKEILYVCAISTIFYRLHENLKEIMENSEIEKIWDKQSYANLWTLLEQTLALSDQLKEYNNLIKHPDITKEKVYNILNNFYKLLGKPITLCDVSDKVNVEQIIKNWKPDREKKFIKALGFQNFDLAKPHFIDDFNRGIQEIEKLINEFNKYDYVISCRNYDSLLYFCHNSEDGFHFWRIINNCCFNYKEIFSNIAQELTKILRKVEAYGFRQIDLLFLNEKKCILYVHTCDRSTNVIHRDEFNHEFFESSPYQIIFDTNKIFNYNNLKDDEKNKILKLCEMVLSQSPKEIINSNGYYNVYFCLLFIMIKLNVVNFRECFNSHFYPKGTLFQPFQKIVINEETYKKISEFLKNQTKKT